MLGPPECRLKVIAGRRDSIGKTVTSSFDLGEDPKAGAAALLGHLRELAAAGIDHVLASPRRSWDEATFEAIASIQPEIHAIEPAMA